MSEEQKIEEALARMESLKSLLEGHGEAIARHSRCVQDIVRQIDQIMRDAGLMP